MRCRRLAPTARAIPISDRRAAASITKIRKISSTPTMIENEPMIMKKLVTPDPASSASASRLCLMLRILNSARSKESVNSSRSAATISSPGSSWSSP